MNISVIGTGYVWLVSGVCFAKLWHDVICMDIDEAKIDKLKKGMAPIYEPGIEELITETMAAGKIQFTTNLDETVQHADVMFLALPTPSDEDGSADLKYVMMASADIAKLLKKYTVIVNKSTVPVGSAEAVRDNMLEHCDAKLFDVVSNPEFLREGKAIEDFIKPDRVVIGAESKKAKKLMDQVYAPMGKDTQIFHMDCRSSEMTKYVANTFLAMKISFINEMSRLCENMGANVEDVKNGIASDHRIGPYFINPGIGYGGSCFPKDVLALEIMAQKYEKNLGILPMIMDGNARQRQFFVDKIVKHLCPDPAAKKVAIWGLAFKPDTDDIREAPALQLIEQLAQLGVRMCVHDPEAMENVSRYFADNEYVKKSVTYVQDPYAAISGADLLALVTEWDIYLEPDFDRLQNEMSNFCIADGRNCFELADMEKIGCHYVSIGRPEVGGESE